MSRDYAPRPPNRRPPPRRPANPPMPGWVWGVIGLSIGLAVAAFVYIGRPAVPMPVTSARPATAITATPPAGAVRPTPRPFTFYELLPNQEMVVTPRTEKGSPAPVAAQADADYLIQVASYRQPQDAERQKATLALIGLEARVETVTIDGRETFYRVRLGPVKGLAAAQAMVARLDENGIESLLVKVR